MTLLRILPLAICFILSEAENVELPPCRPNIQAFSSSKSPSHYYSCLDSEWPVLLECPVGQLYHTRKQICVDPDLLDTPEDKKNVKVLGRNTILGALYDERTEQFYPEASLWTRKTILDNQNQDNTQGSTTIEYSTEKTIKERMEEMDVEAEVQMSFMSGGVKVSGSANFYSDEVTSDTEVNYALLWIHKSHGYTIPAILGHDFHEECDRPDLYTHAVVGVTYGATVNMNFKRQLHGEEREQDIYGDLDIVVKSIPDLDINGGGSADITERFNETLSKTVLRVYGDFSPEEALPSTFEQAVDFYNKLGNEIVGDREDNTIIEVHIAPLDKLCSTDDILLNRINGALMDDIIDMLDELQQVNMKVGALMEKEPAQLFPALAKNLNTFQVALKSYTLNKKSQLQKWLPLSKNGTEGAEQMLYDITGEYKGNTTFRFTDGAMNFLGFREREINGIQKILDRIPSGSENIALTDYEAANDIKYVFEKEMVTIMDFSIISPIEVTEHFIETGDESMLDDSSYWYNNQDLMGEIANLLESFNTFFLANADLDDRGYLYKMSVFSPDSRYTVGAMVRGEEIADNSFLPPNIPANRPLAYNIGHDSFSFTVPTKNFTTGVKVMWRELDTDIQGEGDFLFPEDIAANEVVIVKVEHMKAGTAFEITPRYLTKVGQSETFKTSDPFNTRLTSEPHGLSITQSLPTEVSVSWSAPRYMAPNTAESLAYIVRWRLVGDQGEWSESEEITELSYPISGLADYTEYDIEVLATVQNYDIPGITTDDVHSLAASVSALTAPSAPDWLQEEEIDIHSVLLKWEKPPGVPNDEILHYEVSYQNLGIPNFLLTTEPQARVMNLAQDTSYDFQVKVVTRRAQSPLSGSKNVKTTFVQNSMDKLRDELYGAMSSVSEDLSAQTAYCASQAATNSAGTITYSSFLTQVDNVGGTFDLGSGVFTAGAKGVYQLSLSLKMKSGGSQTHSVWLVKNGGKLENTKMSTTFGSNQGLWEDNASRDIMVNLEKGDQVSATHETDGSQGLENISFCVSSVSFEP